MKRFHGAGPVVSAVVVVSALVTAPCAASARQDGAQPRAVPNIQVAQVLAPVFDDLLLVSPTFVAQCERIAQASYVRVVVHPLMSASAATRGSARGTMHRFSSGALRVSVDMPVPLTSMEYAELFGHEFEHILEQIDRVNLAALAIRGGGATRLADGAYETVRARRAGQAIADESERLRVAATVAGRERAGSAAPLFRSPFKSR